MKRPNEVEYDTDELGFLARDLELYADHLEKKVEDFMNDLELHLQLNEDDWSRNPRAMFEDFKKEQALRHGGHVNQ